MEKGIDFVVPMVFPADPQWQQDYAHYHGDANRAMKHVRFRSWGTEELLVRCCMKYMPWLRRIHILLAGEGQVQEWMRGLAGEGDHAGKQQGTTEVRVVFHREFIPERYLPCFSSPCIEMFLNKIPGLAEQFIYANDDMFPLSLLREEDFFQDGRPCQHIFEKEFPVSPNIYQRKCMYQQNMIGAPYGKHYKTTWLRNGHSFAPILKSSCDEVWRRHGKEITKYLSPLKRTDRSYNHYIYSLYQHFEGLDVDHAPREQYVSTKSSVESIRTTIRGANGILCINDHEVVKDVSSYANAVREELREKTITMSDYRIWVSYHRDELVKQYGLRQDAHHQLFATHKVPQETNTNALNPVYSEMVTMWYVWKNQLRSEYVGFEHYRRHLRYNGMPAKGCCQVFRELDFGARTVYGQYAKCHNAKDMDTMLQLVDARHGKDNPYCKYIRESHRLLANCTFLMAWDDFCALCEYMFPLLEDFGRACGMEDGLGTVEQWHEKAKADFGGVKTEYQRRVVSFLAERLIAAWISTHMRWDVGVTACVVHYNTPEITRGTIRSLWKHSPGVKVVVFDNSDSKPFGEMDGVMVIDNTRGQVIDFEKLLEDYPDREIGDRNKSNFGSAKHCKSVDVLMDMVPEGFLLLDSDVLLTRDVVSLADSKMAAVGFTSSKKGVPLLQPFLCWLNVPMLREHGIRYFNGKKMWALSSRFPDNRYDTGAWLMEEVRRIRLPWKAVDIWEYVVHLGHGSWREKDAQAWLEQHRGLWE